MNSCPPKSIISKFPKKSCVLASSMRIHRFRKAPKETFFSPVFCNVCDTCHLNQKSLFSSTPCAYTLLILSRCVGTRFRFDHASTAAARRLPMMKSANHHPLRCGIATGVGMTVPRWESGCYGGAETDELCKCECVMPMRPH